MLNLKKLFGERTIEDLFIERNEAHIKSTKKIFKAIKGVFDGIYEYMKIATIEKAGGRLEWQDVSYVNDGEKGLVILIGTTSFPEGAKVTLENGEPHVVSKETAPYFRTLVRVGIPAYVAMQSKEQVMAYFDMRRKEEEKLVEQAGVKIPVSDQTISEDDFDLSQLTEEQRKAIITVDSGKQ